MFTHRHKGRAKPKGDHRAQEEAPGIECDDDIDPLVRRFWDSLGHKSMGQMRDQSLEGKWVAEEWEDVGKGYTLRGPQLNKWTITEITIGHLFRKVSVNLEKRFDIFDVRHRSNGLWKRSTSLVR